MLAEPIAPAVDTILIVDDDPARAARIGQVLSLHGYGVLHACGGHAAVDLAREHRPPLVLLSVTTPRGDLAQLCRQLQSDWRCGSPSIIILAGRADVAEFASGLVTTADDYVILEPFDAVRVLSRVAVTLRRAEEMRASSPLTGLPGNTAIETELQRRTAAGEPMALLYIDLDNFKAYNDHYGFLRGDAVIRGVADVLRTAAEKRPGTFLGHVGGDDFVLVSAPENAEDIANEITAGVDERAPFFYDPDDAARGGIDVVDRQGNPHHYPLLTVSIGIARTLDGQIGDHRALVDIATEMKQVAKTDARSAAAMDRRTDHDRGVGPRRPLHRGSPIPRLTAGQLPGRRPHRQSRMRRVGTLVSALLLLPFTLMMGPAIAGNATPGDSLYGAKLALESVRLTLAVGRVREVGLHLDFASLRLSELTELLEGGNPDSRLIEAVTRNFQDHVTEAHQGLQVLKVSGDAEGPRAAQLVAKAVTVEALSETVSHTCGSTQVPASAGDACQEIQQALPTVAAITLMVVPEAQQRIITAIGPPPIALGASPPGSGSSNTSTATAAQPQNSSPQNSSQAGAESDTGKSNEPATSGDGKTASSGEASPKPASAPAQTATSPEPEPTPTPTPTPSPTETPTAATADQQAPATNPQPDGQAQSPGSPPPPPGPGL